MSEKLKIMCEIHLPINKSIIKIIKNFKTKTHDQLRNTQVTFNGRKNIKHLNILYMPIQFIFMIHVKCLT